MSKIDEAKLNDELKRITLHFQQVSARSLEVKSIADSGYSETMDLIQAIREGIITGKSNSAIPNFFPDPYADMMRIEFDIEENVYRAYPVKFLGTDNFKEISEIVRKLGGSYVHGDKTQGVKAHFTIPKGENKT